MTSGGMTELPVKHTLNGWCFLTQFIKRKPMLGLFYLSNSLCKVQATQDQLCVWLCHSHPRMKISLRESCRSQRWKLQVFPLL